MSSGRRKPARPDDDQYRDSIGSRVMTEATAAPLPAPADRAGQMFPVLTPAQIARVARARPRASGRARRGPHRSRSDRRAVLRRHQGPSGHRAAVRQIRTTDTLVVAHAAGQFTGEVNMLSGRRSLRAGASDRARRSDRAGSRAASCRSCRPTARSAKSSCGRSSCAGSS